MTQINAKEFTIQKPEGLVTLKANAPIKIKEIEGSRTFNMVPGAEAIPFEVFFEDNSKELVISITVS